jgi:SAM-dependent methyltransferase
VSRRTSWEDRQILSIAEYEETHRPESAFAPTYRIFRAYVAERAPSHARMLDVGCGLFPDIPPYVPDGVDYTGLDPLDVSVDRSYPFILGTLADVTEKFDLFTFSTSLDHIPDLSECGRRLRELARPGGRAVLLVGLHEPQLVAQMAGAKVFGNLFRDLGWKVPLRLPEALARIGWYWFRLSLRRRQLARGIPLDQFHEHYFTEVTLRAELEAWGRIEDWTRIGATNLVLAAVELRAADGRL